MDELERRLVTDVELYARLHECLDGVDGPVSFAVWQAEQHRIVDTYAQNASEAERIEGLIAEALRNDPHAYAIRVYSADVFDASPEH